MHWESIWTNLFCDCSHIYLFQAPPEACLVSRMIMGVDWEGTPPSLVQIAWRNTLCDRFFHDRARAHSIWNKVFARKKNHSDVPIEYVVYIDKVDSPVVRRILRDPKYTHCVFGEHEMKLVENPVNLQPDSMDSLADTFSKTLYPNVRFKKDGRVHARTDWTCSDLRTGAIQYAASDALATLLIGENMLSQSR